MNYLALYIVSLLVFFSYVGFVYFKYGVHKSISRSYYSLSGLQKALFTLFCWGHAVPIMMIATEISSLFFFAGAGIVFVGAAAQINDPLVKKVHYPAAILAVVLSQIAITFVMGYFFITKIYIFATLWTMIVFWKNWIWYSEIYAYITVLLALALYFNF